MPTKGLEEILAGAADVTTVYVDGIAGCVRLPEGKFATAYYRNVPVKFENGRVIYERAPWINVVRPISSLAICSPKCLFLDQIQATPRLLKTG